VNPFPLVIGELRRSPLGCAAVVALIAVAVALGISVTAQERALRRASTLAAERFDLVVGAAGSPTQLLLTTIYLQPAALDLLPSDVLLQLASEPGALMVAPVTVSDSYRGYVVVGTTAAFAAESGIAEGRVFARDDEAMIGSAVRLALAEKLFPDHGMPVENVLESHAHTVALTVVGRARPSGTPWDRAIIVPTEAIWRMHSAAHERAGDPAATRLGPPWPQGAVDRVPAIVVKPRSVNDAYLLRAKYRTHDSLAVFPAEVLLPLYALLGDLRDFVGAMAIAFQALILVAVILVIVAVLAGRRESIGILRALGAPPAFVFATVWLQAAILIATGVLLGALLGWGLAHALGAFAAARTGLAMDAAIGATELGSLFGLLAAGSLLAVVPSLAAMRGMTARLLRKA
jgi:putative ABC transport system permease protein